MTCLEPRHCLELPPKTRLLHIGPPKTGTSALQNAAERSQYNLYNQGVWYSGKRGIDYKALLALIGKADPYTRTTPVGSTKTNARATPSVAWRDFVASIDKEPTRKILISHEVASRSSYNAACRIVNELGRDRTHVAITLRSLTSTITSRWVQNLKYGHTSSFEEWLRCLYGRSTSLTIPDGTKLTLDFGKIVRRWAAVCGPENVTVIIADKDNKNFLTNSFEGLLGVPAGTLTDGIDNGANTNRSLSLFEAEVIRQLNDRLKSKNIAWPVYSDVVWKGAINQMLSERVPAADEPRAEMPDWAAGLAIHDGNKYAEQIEHSGVRIIGDLRNLSSHTRRVAQMDPEINMEIYQRVMSIAIEGLYGAVAGAKRSKNKAHKEKATQLRKLAEQNKSLERRTLRDYMRDELRYGRRHTIANSFSVSDLTGALGIKIWQRMGRSLRALRGRKTS